MATQQSIPFTLTSAHYTIEGLPSSTTTDDPWWWNTQTGTSLVVSARLDMDGVAATRSPDDLVGRTTITVGPAQQTNDIAIALTGRGAFGKFATGRGKS